MHWNKLNNWRFLNNLLSEQVVYQTNKITLLKISPISHPISLKHVLNALCKESNPQAPILMNFLQSSFSNNLLKISNLHLVHPWRFEWFLQTSF